MKNCEYVKKYYGVPACIGRRVVCDGKPGIIAEDRGAYIGVLLDECKPSDIKPYHPTWKIEYGKMGRVRKMTKSQQRYRDYLALSDCFESFGDYLKYTEWERKNPDEAHHSKMFRDDSFCDSQGCY